jgi:hypothetical protein
MKLNVAKNMEGRANNYRTEPKTTLTWDHLMHIPARKATKQVPSAVALVRLCQYTTNKRTALMMAASVVKADG